LGKKNKEFHNDGSGELKENDAPTVENVAISAPQCDELADVETISPFFACGYALAKLADVETNLRLL
jgi:hypothetical protein